MTHLSRMQKYHGDNQENNSDALLLVEESILQNDEELSRLVPKSKLEKYNTFLNCVIIISAVFLVGIFIAMFFF